MYDHFGYSEWIARNLIAISHRDDECHFLRSNEVEEITDLEDRISSLDGYVLVAIDGHNSDLSWNNGDSLINMPQFFIAIVHPSETGNADSIHHTQRNCRELVFEIVARMTQDCIQETRGLEYLDLNSMTIRGVGPMGDHFYGVMLGFNLKSPIGYLTRPEMWR